MLLTKTVVAGKKRGQRPIAAESGKGAKRKVEVFSRAEVKKANDRLTSPARADKAWRERSRSRFVLRSREGKDPLEKGLRTMLKASKSKIERE